MSLSEACFNLHFSFLSLLLVQEDPQERATDLVALHTVTLGSTQCKETKPGWNLQQCRQSSRFKAHSLYVTFSDIQHCAPAKHAVQKQSLCNIAALLC